MQNIMVLIFECQSKSIVLKTLSFIQSYWFSKFSGGGMPPDPLVWHASHAGVFRTLMLHFSNNFIWDGYSMLNIVCYNPPNYVLQCKLAPPPPKKILDPLCKAMHVYLNQTHAWFLEIVSQKCECACLYICLSALPK